MRLSRCLPWTLISNSICAIAARYYPKRAELHPRLSRYAKRLAFEVPSRGYKSVEVVQAYLLLSLWTLGPEKTFEQDRTWMMLGMAIRMATDLNLHRKSITSGLDTEEGRARDLEVSQFSDILLPGDMPLL